ncbi:centromere-associated protein E-like [Physella acuta]|uniref:centromere-associated protein E-like n=1 Tax=Physella acuta TaxID=109671 RepID=UPI0027DC8B74|nr:centromere-associated protein E-like [Physella acuta]
MDSLKVAVRVRPLLSGEKSLGLKGRWICTNSSITLDQSNTCYVFDRVFDEQISSSTVYNELALDIVKQAMEGFNGTIFTYGQSGSGKTYTLDALRTFAIKTIYEYIENCPTREFLLRVSYVELYNERFYDLLADNAILLLREDLDRNVFLEGLKEEIITSQSHVAQVLAKGNERRHIAETKLNDSSSRSHCIFRIVIESREREDAENSSVYVSHLNLVDLAGSEKAGENSGDRFREGCGINKSLSTLALVIRKLSEEDSAFINYRDSKLTRILQNALGGNSKTAILCTVSPTSVEETHSTLRFGLNAKKVKNKPEQNEVLTDRALLKKSQQEIEKLKAVIKKLESGFSAQTDDELKEQKMKQQQLTEQLRSILCVSSKVNIEKKERNRRQTVCVPQMSRFTAMKDLSTVNIPFSPAIRKKVSFDTKPNENIVAPTAPGAEDQSINHSLSSPCRSHECKCRDLSFTDFEQAFVEEALVQKFKTQINILIKENKQLKVRIQQMHGGLDPNESSVYNMSLGPDFHVTNFSIDEHYSEGIEGARPNLVSNESFVQYELELTDESAQAKFNGKNVDNSFSKRHRYSRAFKGDDSVFESSFLKPKRSRISDLIEEDESEDVSDKNKYDTPESNTTDVSINEEVDCHKDELDKLALDYERSELERERIVLEKEKENIEKLRREIAEQMANMEDKIEMLNNIEKEKKFLEEERKFLQESYKQLEDEKENFKIENEENITLAFKSTKLEAERNQLYELLDELKKERDALREEKEHESKNYEAALCNNEQHNNETAVLADEKGSIDMKYEAELTQLNNVLEQLRRENKILLEEKASDALKYETELNKLKSIVEEDRSCASSEEKAEILKYESEIMQLRSVIDMLRKEKETLAEEKDELKQYEVENKYLLECLNDLKKEKNDLEVQIAEQKTLNVPDDMHQLSIDGDTSQCLSHSIIHSNKEHVDNENRLQEMLRLLQDENEQIIEELTKYKQSYENFLKQKVVTPEEFSTGQELVTDSDERQAELVKKAEMSETEKLQTEKLRLLEDENKRIAEELTHYKVSYENLLQQKTTTSEQLSAGQEQELDVDLDKKRLELVREAERLEEEKLQIEKLREELAEQELKIESKIELYCDLESEKETLEEERKSLKEMQEELSRGKDSLDDEKYTEYESEQNHLLNLIDELKKEKNNLLQENDNLVAKYEAELKIVQRNAEENNSQILNDEQACEDLKLEITQLRSQLEGATKEKDSLSGKKAGELEKFEEEKRHLLECLNNLKKEKDALQEQISEFDSGNATDIAQQLPTDESNSMINKNDFDSKLINLKSSLEQEHADNVNMLQEKLRLLEDKNEEIAKELTQYKESYEVLLKQKASTQEDLSVDQDEELVIDSDERQVELAKQAELLEKEKLQTEKLRLLEDENKHIAEELTQYKESYENLLQQKAATLGDLSANQDQELDFDLDKKRLELVREAERLEEEKLQIEKLREELAEQEKNIESKIELYCDLESEKETLEEERKSLKEMQEELSRGKDSLDDEKYTKYESEQNHLLNLIDELKKEKDVLIQEKETIVNKYKTEIENTFSVIERLKNEMYLLETGKASEISKYETEIAHLNNICEELKLEKNILAEENAIKIDKSERELIELQDLVDKLKAESCFTSEEKASMVIKCETEIANLQNIIDDLNREKKSLQEDKARESAEYEKQIEHLHNCIDELKIERDTLVKNNESTVSNYKTELIQLQAFLEELKQDRDDLANEKAGLFVKHEMDVKQFESCLEEIKKDRDDKDNEIMRYKQQIDQLSSLLKDKESEICVSATEVTKYEAELKQLRNYFDALVEEKDQQLLKNKTEVNDLQKMVEELKRTRDISTEEMVEEISKYKTELAQLHDLHSQLKNERDATLEQMKQMEEQQREFNQAEYLECIQEWQAECEARSTELEEAMKEIENCKKTITWGKQILATRDQEKQEAAKKCEEIEQQVESLKAELHTKSEECSRLQGKVNTHFSNLREIETLKKEVKELNRALQGSKEYYEGVINNLKMKLRNNADSSFAEQRVPSQPVPSIDHLRKIIEFENASKFLELSDLRKKTAEQETKYRNLQTEFTCLKSECEKLKEMQENECMRNEALFSMLNQKSSQLHKSEEELSKFKQSAPLKDKTNENTFDNESTSMLKNSLKESENVNRELRQKIERRDMKWNTLYPKYKSLLEKNCTHEKKIIHLTEEIAELKETLQKIKRAAGQEQVVEKVEPQAEQAANRRDSSRSSQQAEVNQMQPASASKRQHSARSDQENSHITKHLSGGVVENFIVISHERQIKEQQKEINRLKEKLKTFEQSKHQSSENSSNTLEFKLN